MIFARHANSHLISLWGHWYGWILAFVLYDFADYWLHRVSHQSAFFWAAHVVHHQSEFFNLTTALRQESFYPIVGCFFFFPLAILGVSHPTTGSITRSMNNTSTRILARCS